MLKDYLFARTLSACAASLDWNSVLSSALLSSLQGSMLKDSFFAYTHAVYAAGDGIKHTIQVSARRAMR